MDEGLPRLVFIMGVQRSGTNALFHSLAGSPDHAYNEANSSVLFDRFYLRPDAEVRDAISRLTGTVLVKPISETKRRSVAAVLEAYADFRPETVWTYRDPAACFASHIERWVGFRGQPEAFAAEWCERNQSALDALRAADSRIRLVRYEEMAIAPRLVRRLGEDLEMKARSRYRSLRAKGRRDLDFETIRVIERQTSDTLMALDAARFR